MDTRADVRAGTPKSGTVTNGYTLSMTLRSLHHDYPRLINLFDNAAETHDQRAEASDACGWLA
eukprot:scaffold212214_cov15-Prasinocladus_malaysianus.AAC.1